VLDLSSGLWSQKKLRGHVPSPRTSYALACLKTSSAIATVDSGCSSTSCPTSLSWPKLLPSGHLVLSGGEGLGRSLLNDVHVLNLDTMTWIPSHSMHANSPSLTFPNVVDLSTSRSSTNGSDYGDRAPASTASVRSPNIKKKKVEEASSVDAMKSETRKVHTMVPRAGHSLNSMGGSRLLSFGGYGKSSSNQRLTTSQPRSRNSNRSGSGSSSGSGGGSRGYCNDTHVLELTFSEGNTAPNSAAQPTKPANWSGGFRPNQGSKWQGQWRWLECKGRLPPPRAHHSAIAIGPFVAVVGAQFFHHIILH